MSGERFWNFVKQKFVTADNFFKNCFVTNYCPLAFLRESGKNITPSEFSSDLRTLVYDYCDQALLETIHLLKCRIIVAVGKTAYDRLIKLKTVNNPENFNWLTSIQNYEEHMGPCAALTPSYTIPRYY